MPSKLKQITIGFASFACAGAMATASLYHIVETSVPANEPLDTLRLKSDEMPKRPICPAGSTPYTMHGEFKVGGKVYYRSPDFGINCR